MNRRSALLIILLAFVLIVPTLLLLPGTAKADYPNGPTGLSASPGDGHVFLSWNACSGGVQYYQIEVNGNVHALTTYTSEDVEYYPTYGVPLTNGVSYTFRVGVQYSGHGDICYSNEITIAPRPPTVPDTPSITSSSASGNGQVYLAWTTPSDGGASIQGYRIYVDGSERTTTSSTSITISSLTKLQTYTFKVAAYNSVGTGSQSSSASVTVHGVPDAPTGLSATAGNANASLSWNAPVNTGGLSIDYYVVYRDGTDISHVNSGTSYLVTGLTNGQDYSFKVAAHNSDGVGAQTSAVPCIPYTVADAPTGLTSIAGNTQVVLNWAAPAFNGGRVIDYYVVYQDEIDIQHVSGLAYTVNGLTDLQSYSFMVAAHNAAGSGPNSSSADATPFNPPSVAIASPADDSYNNTGSAIVTWLGTDNDGSGLAYYNLSIFNGAIWDNTTNIAPSEVSMVLNDLEDGSYTVHVEVVDNADHSGGASISFIVDTVNPSLVIDSPSSGSYQTTGSVTVAWTESDATSGIAETEISTDGTTWETVTGASGLLTLAEGPHTVYIRVTDHAGNINETSVSFTVDSLAPTLYITSPADSSYNSTGSVTVSWSGSDDDGTGIAYYEASIDGGGRTNLSFATSHTFSGLAGGSHTVAIRAVDIAGNAASDSVSFTVSFGPVIHVTSPVTIDSPATMASPSYTNAQTMIVSGTVTDFAPIASANWTYYVNGIELLHGSVSDLDALYDYNEEYELQLGNNTIVFTLNDTAGNSVTLRIIVFYSTGPVMDYPASPIVTEQNEVDLVISATDRVPMTGGNCTHYLNGTLLGSYSIDDLVAGKTSFSEAVSFQLEQGTNLFVIVVNDSAGNMVTFSLTILYDTTAPTIDITSPGDGSYNNTGSMIVVWSGQDDDFGSGIAYYWVSIDGGEWSNLSTDTSRQFDALTEGQHSVVVNAFDNAGNNATSEVIFIVSFGPLVSISPSSPIYTDQSEFDMTIVASDHAPLTTGNISQYVNGVLMHEDTINDLLAGQTIFDQPVPFHLEFGTNVFFITVNDSAGNSAMFIVTIVYDTTKPDVNIVVPGPGAWYNTTELNITWAANDNIELEPYYWVSLDGGDWINVTSEYNVFSSLPEGQHTIEVRVFDLVGNYNSTSRAFNIETTGPIVSILYPTDGMHLNTSSVMVEWTASSPSGPSRYWSSIDGGEWTEEALNTSREYTLADGAHTISIKVEDFAGNWNVIEASFVVDTAEPTVIANSPTGEDVALTSVVSVTFSEAMNTSSVNIAINGVTGTISWSDNTATFTPSSALASNTSFTVTISGRDPAGNAVSYEWSFITTNNGVIEGVIKDSNGNPIVNATVTLSNGMNATTDSNGHFVFNDVVAGNYNLTVTKDGSLIATQEVTVTAGQSSNLGSMSIPAIASTGNNVALALTIVAMLFVGLLAGIVTYRTKEKE